MNRIRDTMQGSSSDQHCKGMHNTDNYVCDGPYLTFSYISESEKVRNVTKYLLV